MVFSAVDRRGPEAPGGAVLHAGRPASWGSLMTGGHSCRGRSRWRPPSAMVRWGVRLDFLVEAVGPGTERLADAEARSTHCTSHGPPGAAVQHATKAGSTAPTEQFWSVAASGSRQSRSFASVLLPRRCRSARCWAFATRPIPADSSCSVPRKSGSPNEDGRVGSSAVTSPIFWRCAEGRTAQRPPPYTPVARRRCWRPSALICAERGVACRAGHGGADGLRLWRLLRLRRAAGRRRLRAPVRRRPRGKGDEIELGAGRRAAGTDERRSVTTVRGSLELAHPVINGSERSMRSPPRGFSATPRSSAFRSRPSCRRRSPPAARRQPAAAALRGRRAG